MGASGVEFILSAFHRAVDLICQTVELLDFLSFVFEILSLLFHVFELLFFLF
jgi:hypothetical protein